MAPLFVHRLYPRAVEPRLSPSHPAVKPGRLNFLKAATVNFVLLQLLFFGLFCYLFGSLYQQVPRTHHLEVVWVDYDGGIIGEAVRDAYSSLRSARFPTLVEQMPTEFPSVKSLREAVCNTHYWAALYISPRSSEILARAIAGSNSSDYDPSNIIAYIWNEARYPTVVDGSIANNMQMLSERARNAYIALHGTVAFATIPPNNSAAITAFTNPWILSSTNIKPTIQGTRAVYNTIVIVLFLMQDFFFLGIINGLSVQFKIYA